MTTFQRLSESIRRETKSAAALAQSAIAGLVIYGALPCAFEAFPSAEFPETRANVFGILPSVEAPSPIGFSGNDLGGKDRFEPLRT